jgi:dihydrofolate synthase/folylpolyglutamate synthase
VTLQRVLSELATRYPAEDKMVPDLDRISLLCDLLGSPNRAYPAIHLTGTNGKSSTAGWWTRCCRASGCARPLHQPAPGLGHRADRRRRQPISEDRFVEAWDELAPYVALVDERRRCR